MANTSAVHEPSMEEILASIRQIISEDGGGQPTIDGVRAANAAPARREAIDVAPEPEAVEAEAEGAEEAEVEEVRIEVVPPDSARARYEMPVHEYDAAAEIIEKDEEEPYVAQQPEPAPAPSHPQSMARIGWEREDAPLLSPETGQAISGAFGTLAHTMLEQNSRTLEDVVVEMLQPMLKQWLDNNLPAIVERKVQEEIERVSRGRR